MNLIEQVYVEDNTKVQDRVKYFSSNTHSQNVSVDGAQYYDTLFSYHEEADT